MYISIPIYHYILLEIAHIWYNAFSKVNEVLFKYAITASVIQ